MTDRQGELHERLELPEALLSRTDLAELGLPRAVPPSSEEREEAAEKADQTSVHDRTEVQRSDGKAAELVGVVGRSTVGAAGEPHIGLGAGLVVRKRGEGLPRYPAEMRSGALRAEDADARRLKPAEVVLEEARPSHGAVVAQAVAPVAPQDVVDPQPIPQLRHDAYSRAAWLANSRENTS